MNEIEIKYENDQLLVTSLQVAKDFSKEHKSVLRSIENLVAQNCATKNLFYETDYENRGKKYPMYLMTRDGFTLLAMGFTGKDALEWKMKYIQAFNEMERKLNDPMFLVKKSMKYLEEKCNALLEENQEMKPKAEFFDQVASSKTAIQMSEVAKVLNYPGYGRNRLFEFLRNKKVLMANNIPYQKYVDCGYFRVIEQKYTKPSGDTAINIKTLVYQRGINFIKKLLDKELSN
ncbi:phage regulatory protein/antirepressor Ant [Erysipelatoclostridium sp. An173]|uniref:Rha family transcriptional regulator n=1 Tax=Erysipelatoclostridium sp. An173 TaxID=1965571 RepID=UPI003208379E